jgi:hypothetical protein
MTLHPLTTAFEHLDDQPAPGFREALLAELLDDLTQPQPIQAVVPRDSEPQEITVLKKLDRSNSPSTRTRVILGVAAASIVAVGVTAFVVNRRHADTTVVPATTPGSAPEGTGIVTARELNTGEALPLGQAAMISADKLGAGWQQVDDFSISDYATQGAAINAETPACAQLTSVGLAQPTDKSVIVHQDFANGPVPMFHDVWVFATTADASRAMDVIAGDVFPTCAFTLFDRLTALNRNISAESTSTSWQAPPIAAHGNRQIVIGQKIDYTFGEGGAASAEAINAYVQVGRAIAFIDPQYLSDVGPNSNVEGAITASTDALEKVFGH